MINIRMGKAHHATNSGIITASVMSEIDFNSPRVLHGLEQDHNTNLLRIQDRDVLREWLNHTGISTLVVGRDYVPGVVYEVSSMYSGFARDTIKIHTIAVANGLVPKIEKRVNGSYLFQDEVDSYNAWFAYWLNKMVSYNHPAIMVTEEE